MIMIIGGRFQGKTSYALSLGIKNEDIRSGSELSLEVPCNMVCISDFQLFIKKVCENGLDPREKTAELLEKNPRIVIISSEIGNGVIPIEKNDRIWRESVGRACCFLASKAEKVIRMVCGIPTIIKESEN